MMIMIVDRVRASERATEQTTKVRKEACKKCMMVMACVRVRASVRADTACVQCVRVMACDCVRLCALFARLFDCDDVAMRRMRHICGDDCGSVVGPRVCVASRLFVICFLSSIFHSTTPNPPLLRYGCACAIVYQLFHPPPTPIQHI